VASRPFNKTLRLYKKSQSVIKEWINKSLGLLQPFQEHNNAQSSCVCWLKLKFSIIKSMTWKKSNILVPAYYLTIYYFTNICIQSDWLVCNYFIWYQFLILEYTVGLQNCIIYVNYMI